MGSRTVWFDVYDDPSDEDAWRRLKWHYLPLLLRWAKKYVNDTVKAEEIAAMTFAKLVHRVRHGSKKVYPNADGSYRQYVWRVFFSAAMDYLEDEKKSGRVGLTEGELNSLTSKAAKDDLEREFSQALEYEQRLEEFKAKYVEAVRELKAGSRFCRVTYDCFLRIYRDGETAQQIDKALGRSRGLASRNARDTRKSLIRLMDFPSWVQPPPDEERANTILELMVRLYGDPS